MNIFVVMHWRDNKIIHVQYKFFGIHNFSKNKAQINENNYRTMIFMSKQVSLPKLAWSCKKWKSAQRAKDVLFAQNPSIETFLAQNQIILNHNIY